MGLLPENSLLPVTANAKMLAQSLKARQQPRTQLTGQGLLDTAAIGLSPVPIVGDALGLAADASRFYNEPESRTPLNFGLAALGLIPFVPPLVSAGLGKFAQSQGKSLGQIPTGPARNQAGAIVYHGSPHKFDQFDSSKIGTGEGAQAYGHGLYFAENPSVASTYTGGAGDVYGMSVKRDNGKYHAAAFSHSDPKFRKESYFDSESDANKWISEQSGGSLYKVDLPDEAIAKMLDWDKPLSQQAPEVQKAFANSQAKYGPLLGNKPILDPSSPIDGQSAYRDLTNSLVDGQVRRGSTGAADKLTSEYLRQLGIPGIRYLDGGSRGSPSSLYQVISKDGKFNSTWTDKQTAEKWIDGYKKQFGDVELVSKDIPQTSNYVVFPGNEGLLKILGRE